jgi:16S rRNA C967 or C1407 C5-methylase (RsmB/RsmF family)/NOL1/NOP2/fmu family ribosome biogenesis protein
VEEKSVPRELLHSLKDVEGFDEKSFLHVHEHRKPVVSIRVNTQKIHGSPFDRSEKIPWSSTGYYLAERPSFTLDPLLHAGAYYVQEASSMFLEQCLRQTTDIASSLKVLDLCAAPGGKSTLIQSLISENSLLVSNEVIKTRVGVLIENLSKWGAENIIVTNNDPRDFSRLPGFFDVMVVDAPCSGSGLFRRDPDAIGEWSPNAVETCSMRQQRILADAYSCLKQNGVLIYSTCSYSPEEDENISDWLLSEYNLTSVRVSVSPEWQIIETRGTKKNAYGYRFFPDKVKGEGFYIACFRKNDNEPPHEYKPRKNKIAKVTAMERAIIQPWIKENAHVNFYKNAEDVYAFPRSMENDLIAVQANLYIRKSGVHVGKIVRDELVPAHELAVSGLVSEKIISISLKKEDALQYLRKEEVTIKAERRGWALVRYQGQNLGWIKMLGNRSNNYYPKEWRILKSANI